jgi:hypothetical protein
MILVAVGCNDLPSQDDPRGENCGDGWLDPGEQCDEGQENADDGPCTRLCRRWRCGDGLVGPGETCDDGNDVPDDDCDQCHSPFDPTWVAWIGGCDSIAAGPDGAVYVAGLLKVPDDPDAHPLAVVERATGSITTGSSSSSWDALAMGSSSHGALSVAARPAGGAVVAGHFFYDGSPVAVAGWFDASGALEARYQYEEGTEQRITTVAVDDTDSAVLGGSQDAYGWALVISGDQAIWDTTVTGATGMVALTSVDLKDGHLIAQAGTRSPQIDPVLGLTDGVDLVWGFINPRMDEELYLDVRWVNEEYLVAHTWRDGPYSLVVERHSLVDGAAEATTTLDHPNNLIPTGVRILPDGRALSFGKTSTARWLVLHGLDGSVIWRANPRSLQANVLDADSVDGTWVYAVLGGVAVAGWQVRLD